MDRRKSQGIEERIPIASGIRSGKEFRGLDAASYTAQRLQHASPEHLHITSRRTFIGPLPSGWLRMHGKSWYKRLTGFQDYSSRSISFVEGPEPPEERQELEEQQEEAGGKFQASMTTPEEEVSVDERADNPPPERDVTRPLGHPNSPRSPSQMGQTIELSDNVPRTHKYDPRARYGESPVVRTDSSDSDRNMMFVNAPEPGDLAPKTSPCRDAMVHGPQTASPSVTGQGPPQSSKWLIESPVLGVTHIDRKSPQICESLNQPSRKGGIGQPSMQQTLHESPPRYESPREHHKASPPPPMRDTSPTALEDRSQVKFAKAEEPNVTDVHPDQGGSLFPGKDDPRMTGRRSEIDMGDIVKAERMLVRVDATDRSVPSDYNETYSYGIPVDREKPWKEYIAVCRRMDDNCSPFQLEFYSHRDIPMKIDVDGKKRKLRHSIRIALDCTTTYVNLWSALDKTIVIWHRVPNADRFQIHVMRTRSPSHSIEWYTFIREALGSRRPSNLLVHIPDLNVRVHLSNMTEQYGRNPHALVSKNEAGGLELLRSMTITPKEAVSEGIIESCFKELQKQQKWANLIDVWNKFERLGLAWRRYDRLEWVHGSNERRMYGSLAMEHTHQLEMRPRTHYPTCADEDGEEVEEPPPVEGFLVLLTSRMGKYRRLGQRFSKRLYCNTHDQYLFFSGPADAAPPGPPKLPEVSGKQMPRQDIRKEMPLIYEIDPYPLEDGKIRWLCPGRRQIARSYDMEAYREALRNTANVRQTDGYIDLTQTAEVHKVDNPYIPPWWKAVWQSPHTEGTRKEEPNAEEGVFEIVMLDGLRVRFRAFNSRTRDEWICRLSALSKYWKHRLRGNLALLRTLRHQNLQNLHISEWQESVKGQFAQKWEVSQADASPKVFNICNVSACRSIKMSGVLFCKTRRHNRYERQGLILTDGVLLFFQEYIRSFTGRQLSQTHHDHSFTLDLRDCYIYSGPITRHDILYWDQTSSTDFPRHTTASRIYLNDGWTSSDDSAATTFVIWQNSRKTISHTEGELKGDRVEKGSEGYNRWTRLPTLGVKGRSFVFEARSRVERDLWVLALQTEVDRLQQEKDASIVEQGTK
ncbi:hypothetical protein KEM56_001533 [Ascosphaera pollenicola]|nr:hypothetical protein KEM56_001533 [Ascosphaera pollenicola]